MPEISGILETAVYAEDLSSSLSFYQKVFRFPVMYSDHRLCALNAGPRQVLLLFLKGGSTEDSNTPGGIVPAHDGAGQLHLAFAIAKEELERWEQWLQEAGIPIESTVRWAAGGTSLYFRDPDGHLLELATPGLWANY
jgi:catechol 2,3-dioxygenase-like lactoylglutathione lyase family enzyme